MREDSLLYCAFAIAVFDLLCAALFAALSLGLMLSHVSSCYLTLPDDNQISFVVELAYYILCLLWNLLVVTDFGADLGHLQGKLYDLI